MIPLAENAYPAVPPVFTARVRAMHSDRITPVYVVGYLRIFVTLYKYFALVTNILRLTTKILRLLTNINGQATLPPRRVSC